MWSANAIVFQIQGYDEARLYVYKRSTVSGFGERIEPIARHLILTRKRSVL